MPVAFKGEPSVLFRRGAKWNHDLATVDFMAEVSDDEGQGLIVCRVAREALDDRLPSAERVDPLTLFKRLKGEVRAVAENKLMALDFEPDGSILVRSEDLNG